MAKKEKVKAVFQTPEEKALRRKEVAAKSREKRKEKIALYYKEYNSRNREKVLERNREYYTKNKGKFNKPKQSSARPISKYRNYKTNNKYRVLKTIELKTKLPELVDYQECDNNGN